MIGEKEAYKHNERTESLNHSSCSDFEIRDPNHWVTKLKDGYLQYQSLSWASPQLENKAIIKIFLSCQKWI